jgi:membrane-associated phospholipid phosphatase
MFVRNRFFPATKLFFMITLLAGLVTANPIQARFGPRSRTGMDRGGRVATHSMAERRRCCDSEYSHKWCSRAFGLTPDSAWTPWLDSLPPGTPAHPEYPSGHSTVSGSAAYIFAAMFGDNTAFTVTSEIRSGTRSFPSFSAAVAEIADARVFGGIHFRVSCVRGNALGQSVAAYVSTHAMRPLDD